MTERATTIFTPPTSYFYTQQLPGTQGKLAPSAMKINIEIWALLSTYSGICRVVVALSNFLCDRREWLAYKYLIFHIFVTLVYTVTSFSYLLCILAARHFLPIVETEHVIFLFNTLLVLFIIHYSVLTTCVSTWCIYVFHSFVNMSIDNLPASYVHVHVYLKVTVFVVYTKIL